MAERFLSRRRFCVTFGASAAAIALTGNAGTPLAGAKSRSTDMIGRVRTFVTGKSDTLVDLARQFGLGFTEIVAANPGIDPWVPGAGTRIVLPTGHILPAGPREGLVLNLIDQRIYFFPPSGGPAESFPIGTGREGWGTPTGATKIVRKKRRPAWYVPKSIREEQPDLPAVVPPGPDNPLGLFAMYLGWPSYLIHGTNQPWGVGRRVSHGCIRLYPEDIARLFPRVPIGISVAVVREEVKIGRVDGQLMLEIHPDRNQNDEIEASGRFTPTAPPELAYKVVTAAGDDVERINWSTVRKAARERRGVPVPILNSKAETVASRP